MIGVRIGEGSERIDALVRRLVSDRVASGIAGRDATLWGADAEPEARIRLDWVDAAAEADGIIPRIEALRAEFAAQGVDRFVLCGMGGSSLAPEVICARYGVALEVLDSTHPTQVARALDGDLARTAVIVGSKSGSTIETRSHLAAFEAAFREAGIEPASRVVIVTDPGSPLDAESRAAGRIVFNANPNVGGRFSALTAFGLVPSGLAGADVRGLVAEAAAVRELLAADSPDNPAVQLATAIAAGLPERYAIVLHECENEPAGLGDWIEQLLAESTGKQGKGVLPVVTSDGSPEPHNTEAPRSSSVVNLEWQAEAPGDLSDLELEAFEMQVFAPLGAQMLLWEFATAVLGRCMGIDPFNQPDVESAKAAARGLLEAEAGPEVVVGEIADLAGVAVLAAGNLRTEVPGDLASLRAAVEQALPPGGYLAIQAYLDRGAEWADELVGLRDRLVEWLGVPVTLGWGPRFLHSTGQLHKGGPKLGVFLQLLDRPGEDREIPGMGMGFGTLLAAQAAGDRNVLAGQGRPVIALRLGDPAAAIPGLF